MDNYFCDRCNLILVFVIGDQVTDCPTCIAALARLERSDGIKHPCDERPNPFYVLPKPTGRSQ